MRGCVLMIKIVYFDELSANDYLNIYNGGQLITTSERMKEQSHELSTRINTAAKLKSSWLSFLGLEAGLEAGAEYAGIGNSLINTTISNTILTDFIHAVGKESAICKMEGYRLRTYANSIAFYKIFTPYLTIAKSPEKTEQGIEMDISKMDEAFKNAKGYYEIIAEKETEGFNDRRILRFNINAFRNSYNISDLLKMDLEFYAIRVGRVSEEMLDINKELGVEEKIFTAFEDLISSDNQSSELDVYDVILAGVN